MTFTTFKLNKSILDPIHGLIRMTEEEMDGVAPVTSRKE